MSEYCENCRVLQTTITGLEKAICIYMREDYPCRNPPDNDKQAIRIFLHDYNESALKQET